jgi:hypothetical protein
MLLSDRLALQKSQNHQASASFAGPGLPAGIVHQYMRPQVSRAACAIKTNVIFLKNAKFAHTSPRRKPIDGRAA